MNSLKYYLFDLAVLISLLIVTSTAYQLLRDQRSTSTLIAKECDAKANVTSALEQECDVIANSTLQASLSREQQCDIPPNVGIVEPRSTYTIPSSNNDDSSHLKIGSIVELYADTSYFAIPAFIKGYKTEGSSTQYIVENTVTSARLPQVEAEFIHPYQVYEDGTRASCNVGALRSIIYMTPCAVVSHSIRKSGVVIYQVSYLNAEKQILVHDYLPFSRVQRNNRRRNGISMVA